MLTMTASEYAKYTQIWNEVPEYRNYSPGLENFPRFMDTIKPERGSTLIDIGCGTGEAGLAFREVGLDVSWIDITDAGLHEVLPRNRFIQTTLWSDWKSPYGYDYGFCCDVMEHIPTEYVMLVLSRILNTCRTTWFQIAFVPDEFGKAIDQPLHLTVKPFNWWLEHLESIGTVLDARDLCGAGIFIVGRRNGSTDK